VTKITCEVTISHRYFAKRSRTFNIQHIRELCQVLDRPAPADEDFKAMTVNQMASMSMRLHQELPP
jgi:hypothetical protein